MNHVVILNGPPGSGKDTIADFLCSYRGWVKMSFKEALVIDAIDVAGVEMSDWNKHYTRDLKEVPWSELPFNLKTGTNYTPREWLIHLSEEVTKPNHGKDYFGKKLLEKIKELLNKRSCNIVISDGGFFEEMNVLAEAQGLNLNYRLSVVKLVRDGCNFDNDSRDYVEIPNCNTYTVVNNGEITETVLNVLNGVGEL